jgi:peptide/nickel transport system substrate-binding protein
MQPWARAAHLTPVLRRAAIGAVVLLTACAAPQSAPVSGVGQPAAAPVETKVLRMADRTAPMDLADKTPAGGMSERTKRLFNAFLVLTDDQGTPHPYLAETLPQLDAPSWAVSSDGRMQTTYRLRPNLTWHDGQPLTADDFVFAYQVYTTKAITMFSQQPQDQMESVTAPDPQTLVIAWKSLYPRAGLLAQSTFGPLPRHILAEPFAAVQQDAANADAFANLRYWGEAYVGAGPYKLVHWERGISIEGEAFDGHALGKPKITRILRRYFADENAVLANVLAGEIDFADVTTLRFNHGQTLQEQWVAQDKGRLLFLPTAPLAPAIQFRPELQKSPPLLDVRVRRALSYGIDRDAVSETMYPGQPSMRAETLISKLEPYYDQIDQAITKYPHDPRRTEQLMTEAGLAKDRDGFYADAQGSRFQPYFQVLTNVDSQRMQLVVADGWKQLGIDVQPDVLPQALVADADARARSNVGMATAGSGLGTEPTQVMTYASNRCIPRTALMGRCGSGYANVGYDSLLDRYDTTLDRTQQIGLVVQMMKILSEDVPTLPVYYNIYVIALAAGIQGPTVGTASTIYWNLETWEYR